MFKDTEHCFKVLSNLCDELGIEPTVDNIEKLSQQVFYFGVNAIINVIMSQEKLASVFAEPEAEPTESKVQFVDIPIPLDICPSCGKRVIFNGKQWACNCETYLKGPQPEPVCPHCKTVVVAFSYYWKCRCNRYSIPPVADAVVPEPVSPVWANAFPS